MLATVQKLGDDRAIRFDVSVLKEARIGVGDRVNVFAIDGRIIIEPADGARGKTPADSNSEVVDWAALSGEEITAALNAVYANEDSSMPPELMRAQVAALPREDRWICENHKRAKEWETQRRKDAE